MHSVTYEDVSRIDPPPLGDLTARRLVIALMACWAAGVTVDASAVLPGRGASVNDLRAELQRREQCVALVQR